MKSLRNLSLGLIFAMAFVLSVSAKADAAVTDLRQTDATSSSFELAWNSDASATGGYRIEVGTDGKSFPMTATTSRCEYYYSNNISAGNTYYVRIGSVNGSAVSSYSNIIQVVTRPTLQTPKMVQSGATTNSITLKWDAVPGATGYRVYRYIGYNNYPIVATVTGTTATIAGGLTANQKITYFVCPIRSSSAGFVAEGYDSNNVYAKTAPAKVIGLGVSNIWWSIRDMRLTWGAQNNVDGYALEIFDNKGKKMATLDRSYNYYDFGNMSYNTFYSYRVRAYINVNGGRAYGAWSDKNYTGLQPKVSLKKQSGGKKIKVGWKKVKGATGYVVYASTIKDGGFKKVATVKKSKKSYTITKIGKKKLKKNKTYYIYVVAKKKVGKKTYTTPADQCWYLSRY